MITKRQHYVTRSYLTLFSTTDGGKDDYLWVYDKEKGDVRLQPIGSTAVVRHFYTFDSVPEGLERDWLEKVFAKIESEAMPIIKEWGKPGTVPTVKEIPTVAMFLACLYVRVPRAIEIAQAIGGATAVARMQAVAEDDRRLDAFLAQLPVDQQRFTREQLKVLIKDIDVNYSVNTHPKQALLVMIDLISHIYPQLIERLLADSGMPNGGTS